MIALLAYGAFAASTITTVISLTKLLYRISSRAQKVASTMPTKIVRGSAEVVIDEIARAREDGKIEVAIIGVKRRISGLGLEGAESYGARIWTKDREPFAIGSAWRAKRSRTIDLQHRPLFVATGSETILATYDPRPDALKSLFLANVALLLVIEWSAISSLLLFMHPMESPLAKVGALMALAQFLLAPLLERAVRISARDPDEPGARWVEAEA
jgi:hypothetical protein